MSIAAIILLLIEFYLQ